MLLLHSGSLFDWCSFEWQVDMSSWRASVQMWRDNVYYRHSKSGNRILADSGWHCSYCFRTIPEYIVKMKGFSHSDRIGGNMRLLDPRRIQDTICRGKDIFGMLPEAYNVGYAILASVTMVIDYVPVSRSFFPNEPRTVRLSRISFPTPRCSTSFPVRLKTAVGLPEFLINNAERFRFLLPNGCVRET